MAAYEPGEAELPAIEVTYLGARGDVRTVRTEPVPIKIASLIANEPEPALKDGDDAGVGDGGEPRAALRRRAALLAAALGALITFLIVRKLRARRGERPGPPPRPAHEIALERLDRLGAYGFLENADNRPFYFAVSEVIRDYLGGALRLRLAGDDHRRAGRGAAGPRRPRADAGEIQGWLAACDLVKFAKVSPTAAEARGALESAIRIVTTTRPAPVAAGAARRAASRRRAMRDGKPPTARRAPIPYALIAAVFVPLAVALRAAAAQRRRASASRTRALLALIPPAVALVLWIGLARGAGAARVFHLFARRASWARSARGSWRACAICRRCCGWRPSCWSVVALARPQSTRRSDDLELEGIDIVIALDLSGSMQETDLVPNRLEAAKAVIQDFVRRRPDRSHRPGRVRARGLHLRPADARPRHAAAHAGRAAPRDHRRQRHRNRQRHRRRAQPAVRRGAAAHHGGGQGAAQAAAPGAKQAPRRPRNPRSRSKVMIVLTDGENNAGKLSPEDAARWRRR